MMMTLMLPEKKTNKGVPMVAVQPADKLLNKRVLVVDDEEKLGRFVSMLLQRSGYEVTTCTSAAAAKESLLSDAYSLVITDIVMPMENGLQLVQWLNDNQPQTPVVVMTAHSTQYIDDQAIELGVVDILHKPFSLEQLRRTVERNLQL